MYADKSQFDPLFFRNLDPDLRRPAPDWGHIPAFLWAAGSGPGRGPAQRPQEVPRGHLHCQQESIQVRAARVTRLEILLIFADLSPISITTRLIPQAPVDIKHLGESCQHYRPT